MIPDDERSEWEGLTKSPGWLRLKAWAAQEWAAKLQTHVTQAANDTDDLMALQKLRQVVAAHKAVEGLLQYPTERLAALTSQQKHAAVGYSRGGL